MNLTEVTVARTITAKPNAIFDLFIDPNVPGGPWFGAVRLLIDVKVDGLFYFLVSHEGKDWAHYGRFLRIEHPSASGNSSTRTDGNADAPGIVEYTWMSEATRGAESIVTVTFAPLGEETEVTLRHSNVPDDEMGRRHADGWTWMLNLLAERFSIHEDQA
jgi:uncharacterized protein YndB with AHSA1/START domain